MPTRLITLCKGTANSLRMFEMAQVLQLTGCVEGSSLRLLPADGRREELAGGIPENHSVGIYRRGPSNRFN